MESSGAQNIIAAAYLTGAAEALKKSLTLGREDVEKNLEDLKPLRRQFLNRAESDGYKVPNDHIYNAKLNAYKLLKTTTRFPNTFAKDLQPIAEESSVPYLPSIPEPTVPQEASVPQIPTVPPIQNAPFISSMPEPTVPQVSTAQKNQQPRMNNLQQGGARKKATRKRKLNRRNMATRVNRR